MLWIVSTDLKKRLKHKADYLAFLSNTISGGHAKNFPGEEVSKENSAVHPAYHPVYQPKTQGKIRVVFICRVEFQRIPQQMAHRRQGSNKQLSMLCRFRQELVAVMGNFKGIFHQVPVNPQSIAIFSAGHIDSDPKDCRTKGCTNFALKKFASDDVYLYEEEEASFLYNRLYVDNSLKSLVWCNIKGCYSSCCYVINNECSTQLVSASSSFCFVKPRICVQCCIFSSKR